MTTTPSNSIPRRSLFALSLALCGLLLFMFGGFSQGPATFQHYTAKPGGEIALWEVVDWDADGEQELVIVAERASVRQRNRIRSLEKCLLVYELPNVDGGDLDPAEVHLLDDHVTGVALGRPKPGAMYQLYCFGSEGVSLVGPGEDSPAVQVYQGPSFFDRPGRDLVRYRGLADLNGDGLLDIVYPTGMGYELLTQTPGDAVAYARMQNIDVLHPAKLSSFWGSAVDYGSSLSVLNQADVNNDGRQDLVSLGSQNMLLFLQQADGTYAQWAAPAELEALDRESIQVRVFQIADIDADGLNDMLSTMIFGKFGVLESLQTKVHVKYGERGKNLLEQPFTQTLLRKGVSAIPTMEDVNGDGCPDLLLSSVRTDMLANAVAYFKDSIDVHYYLFQFDRVKHEFPGSYAYNREVKLQLGEITAEKTIPGMWMSRDLDGDGKVDLVHYDHSGSLFLYSGKSGDGPDFPKDPTQTFQVQPQGKCNPDFVWVHFVPLRGAAANEIMVHDAFNHEVHLIARRP